MAQYSNKGGIDKKKIHTPRQNRHSGQLLTVSKIKEIQNFAQISLDYFNTSSNCVSMLTLILRMTQSFN